MQRIELGVRYRRDRRIRACPLPSKEFTVGHVQEQQEEDECGQCGRGVQSGRSGGTERQSASFTALSRNSKFGSRKEPLHSLLPD